MSPSSYQLLHSAIYLQPKLLNYYITSERNVNTFFENLSVILRKNGSKGLTKPYKRNIMMKNEYIRKVRSV